MKEPRGEGKITDLARSWDMPESEAIEVERVLREGWKRWKPPHSV